MARGRKKGWTSKRTDLFRRAIPLLAEFKDIEIGLMFRVHPSYISILRAGKKASQNNARDVLICDMIREGRVLEEVGQHFELSRERVRQIAVKYGVDTRHGMELRSLLAPRLSVPLGEKRERIVLEIYGCSREEATRLNDGRNISDSRSPAHAYLMQRKSALDRGIGWEMTFPEWLEIWQASGKLAERGRGRGKYCMSRYGDTGAYSKDNVRIISNEQNAAESYERIPFELRQARRHTDRMPRPLNEPSPLQAQCWELREQGLGPTSIAEKLGLKAGTVAGAINAYKHKMGML